MIDHLLRAQLIIGRMAQAVGKGESASGESAEWGTDLRDWRTQLRTAAAELEQEARAITVEAGGHPGWVLACSQFEAKPGATNGSCGNCRHFDWRGDKCGLRN